MRAELGQSTLAGWAQWNSSAPYSVGVEEEVMLLDPRDWSLAQRIDDVLPRLSSALASRATAETHGAAIELASQPHDRVEAAAREITALRAALARELAASGLRVASAGTHPFALWTATEISSGARYQLVYEAMRELARAPEPDAGAPPAAAGVVGQLPLLAGSRHRLGVGANASLPGVPARGDPARLRFLRRLRRDRRSAAAL
jgi:hypothetical protein